MIRKIVGVLISLALVLGVIIIVDTHMDIIPIAQGAVHYVNETGSAGAYSKIQDAINASSDGDTVFVYSGTYYENVLVNKRVDLIGSGSDTTLIDGGWKDHKDVVSIMSNWVNMSGFELINSYMGHEFAGIGVYTSYNRIFDNHCHQNLYGMIIWGGQNRISNNSFSDNERDGIFVKSSGNIIENNTCSGSLDRDGIWLYICGNNTVSNNTCSNNYKNGISFYQSNYNHLFNNKCNKSILYDGILIYESSNNVLWNNTLSSNNRAGLAISHLADNNTLTNNTIFENQMGVMIDGTCSFNKLQYNNIILNTLRGIHITGSSGNMIHHNNIIDNANQAYDDKNDNYWDDGYPSGGNYWSDYDGIDLNSTSMQNNPPPDGIGDIPYEIDSDSLDSYPLMSPSGNRMFLYKGWNLISIPLVQSTTSLDDSLSSISGSYDAVQYYDSTDSNDLWKDYHISKQKEMNDLKTINHSMGFFIHIKDSPGVLFEYHGTHPTMNQTLLLHPGWNLVGYPSLSNHNRTLGLNNIKFDLDVDCIQWYDASAKAWHFMGPDDVFVPGRGYWMHSNIESIWDVPL